MDTIVNAEIVGEKDIFLTLYGDEASTMVNFKEIFTALGCTEYEFEETGMITPYNGKFFLNGDYYVEDEGYWYNAEGAVININENAESMIFNINFESFGDNEYDVKGYALESPEEGKLYSTKFRYLYGDKQYIITVYLGNKAEIDGIDTITGNAVKSGNIYSVSGQLVRKNAASTEGLVKGIYIMNGKKIVVK